MKKTVLVLVLCFLSVMAFSYTDTELKIEFEEKLNTNHVISKISDENAAYDLTDNIFCALGVSKSKIDYAKIDKSLYSEEKYQNKVADYIVDLQSEVVFDNKKQLMECLVNNVVNSTKISYFDEKSVMFNLSNNDIKKLLNGAKISLNSEYLPKDEEIKSNFSKYYHGLKPNDSIFCKGFMSMDISNIVTEYARMFYDHESNLREKYKGKTIKTDFGYLEILAPRDSVKCRIIKNENFKENNEKIYFTDKGIFNSKGLVTGIIIDASDFKNEKSQENLDYCVYPRIRVPNGDVVYSSVLDLYTPNTVSYASYINKDDTETLNEREGENPLIIKPYGIAGIPGSMCDIVLSENDAYIYKKYITDVQIISRHEALKHANYLTERVNEIPRFLFAENYHENTFCGQETVKTTFGMYILQRIGIIKSL